MAHLNTHLWKSIVDILNKPWFLFGIMGMIMLKGVFDAYLYNLMLVPEYYYVMTKAFGAKVFDFLKFYHLAAGFILFGATAQATKNLIVNIAWPKEKLQEYRNTLDGFSYNLPEWPENKGLSIILGESHGKIDGGYISNPSWCTI
ncbi:MAG: hypothetical protein ACOCQQ_02820, partial [Candidatus Nanoarchaeia archaeon]